MPSFAIHIAAAKQYMKHHPAEIKEENKFIKGAIAPDLNEEMTALTTQKDKTHYGMWGIYDSMIHFQDFLADPKVKIQEDYGKGYFLHLLTDYYFYHQYFQEELEKVRKNGDNFHHDYDCLNKALIPKYKISIIEEIKRYVDEKDEESQYLKIDKIIDFIEEIGRIELQEQIKKINKEKVEGIK